MKVKDIMNKNVKTIEQNKTVKEAATQMKEFDCGSLPVQGGDRIVGMLTDRDIALRSVTNGVDTKVQKVKDIMTEGIKYCYEDQDVEEVGQLMSKNRLRRLPVLNEKKRLVGIVTTGDVASKAKNQELLYKIMNGVCG